MIGVPCAEGLDVNRMILAQGPFVGDERAFAHRLGIIGARPHAPLSMRNARGFTIVEILVVLIILSIVMAMAALVTRGISAGQKRSITTTRLTGVDAAIAQFVAVQKRMPCPADGTKASADANAGVEIAPDAAAGCNAQSNGVVPWRSLGLSEQDATDGWERRLTYRTDPLLGRVNAMNMSSCDPAGSEGGATPRDCNTACTSAALGSCTPPVAFITGKGLTVRNVAGTTVMDPTTPGVNTGAAYVVISHGESGGGGFLNTGNLSTSTTTDGTEEGKNYANLGLVAGVTYYVDDSINDNAGGLHYDDLVSRPALLSLVSKAGLGPRSH